MKKNWSVVSKMICFKNICTFIGSYCAKYLKFELKKYRGVIFHDNEEWCKIWRKTDLWFGKWNEEYCKSSPEYFKISKLGVWWGPLIQSRKRMSLKFTKEFCVMTMKNDAKLEEKLTFRFKIDMGNWLILTRALKSLKNFNFNVLLLSKLYRYRGVIFHETEEWYKIWRGIDMSFENWPEDFEKVWPEHSKVSKIFTLMVSFWTKYLLFELKKYRGVIFHETEEWCKVWRKTDLWFGKWHGEFGKFSPHHLKVSKLRHWSDPFVQSRTFLSLKFTEELCVMTMKDDAKFEQELTSHFKIDRNLTNSDSNTWLKICF